MTLLLNSNLTPCVAHLLHQLHHIPTRKTKPADSNDTFGICKSARLALKTNKNLSNALIHLDPPKLSKEKKHSTKITPPQLAVPQKTSITPQRTQTYQITKLSTYVLDILIRK